MSERRHYTGGIISIEANSRGEPQCVTCELEIARDRLAMLIRDPVTDVWMAYCRVCMVAILRASASNLTTQILSYSTET